MPNNLDDQVMTEVINYSKEFKDKLKVNFEGFFKGGEGPAFKKESLRFLEAKRPSDSLLKKSSDEYSKVTEVADKNLQTSLKPDLDGLLQEMNSSLDKCKKNINNFKKNVEKGYITAPETRSGLAYFILSNSVKELKKHSDIIIKKSKK